MLLHILQAELKCSKYYMYMNKVACLAESGMFLQESESG